MARWVSVRRGVLDASYALSGDSPLEGQVEGSAGANEVKASQSTSRTQSAYLTRIDSVWVQETLLLREIAGGEGEDGLESQRVDKSRGEQDRTSARSLVTTNEGQRCEK